MKKIVFPVALVLFIISAAKGQVQKVQKTEIIRPTVETPSKTIKTVPAEPKTPPSSPATNKITGIENQNTPVYKLTSVRVNIKTGSDNKEFPSQVFVSFRTLNAKGGQAPAFSQFALNNEMKINSNTEFGLNQVLEGETNLESFQTYGSKLMLNYTPNFFADAWKIESVSVVLEFKDQNGNPHPTLGSKTIVFGNAYGFLDNTYRIMDCTIDGSFSPLTALIRKP